MAWQSAQFYSHFCKVMKDVGQCRILATSCNELEGTRGWLSEKGPSAAVSMDTQLVGEEISSVLGLDGSMMQTMMVTHADDGQFISLMESGKISLEPFFPRRNLFS